MQSRQGEKEWGRQDIGRSRAGMCQVQRFACTWTGCSMLRGFDGEGEIAKRLGFARLLPRNCNLSRLRACPFLCRAALQRLPRCIVSGRCLGFRVRPAAVRVRMLTPFRFRFGFCLRDATATLRQLHTSYSLVAELYVHSESLFCLFTSWMLALRIDIASFDRQRDLEELYLALQGIQPSASFPTRRRLRRFAETVKPCAAEQRVPVQMRRAIHSRSALPIVVFCLHYVTQPLPIAIAEICLTHADRVRKYSI